MHNSGSTSTKLPCWLVIGFSGHRHLEGNESQAQSKIEEILDDLTHRHPRIAGVCSAASGADTLFAEAMLRREAPLSLILPFDVVRFKEDFKSEPEGSWDRAQKIIREVPAHRIDIVHEAQADLAEVMESALSAEDRKKATAKRDALAYYEATVRTVDHADILLVVWNEKPGVGVGGTADAVAYAAARGIPVIVYNPEVGDVTRNEIAQLKFHFEPGKNDPVHPREMVDARLKHYDDTAKKHQQPVQSLMQLCVSLHLLASAAGAFAIIFVKNWHLAMGPALLEVGILGWVYYLLAERSQHHHQWFTSRVEAEICRTFQSTWDIRRHPSLIHQPRPAIADHLEEPPQKKSSRFWRFLQSIPLPRRREVAGIVAPPEHLFRLLRFLRDLDVTPVPELKVARDTYVNERMTGINGQIPYFIGKLEKARCTYGMYKLGGGIASGAALISAILVVCLMPTDAYETLTHWFEYFGIVMPLAATAFTFLMVSSDASRRVHRYEQMINILYKLLPTVQAAPTWDALSRAVTQVEEELLQEIVEWQSFVHYTEHLH